MTVEQQVPPLAGAVVDSHCHMDTSRGENHSLASVSDALAAAAAVGVSHVIQVGCDVESSRWALSVAQQYDNVWATVAIHPNDAARDEDLATSISVIRELAASPVVRGIGETGLDYYYEHSPRQPQQKNFRMHIAAARKLALPVIVHTRDADDDTIAILEDEMARGAFTGVIHCFTGTQRLADAALAMGLYISVSGIATFKNSGALRDVIKSVPLDRLLVETDAPFLAPVPHRGKTNEPAFVVHTARMLAELKTVSEQELAAVTTDNFFHLFSKVRRPA